MSPDTFAGVVVALARVALVADRLPDGDTERHVRRSIEEFGVAFSDRAALEPVVARMRGSILMLHDCRLAGRRRAYEQDRLLVTELDRAIEEQLLPALRRIGFGV